jgi:hypothetical protein
MLQTQTDPRTLIAEMVRKELKAVKPLDIFVVTGVDTVAHTLNIKRMNVNESYSSVAIVGLGLGNGRGQLKLPLVGDVVVAGFLANSETPVVLGTVFDVFSTVKDAKLDIRLNEYFVNNRTNGAYIHIDDANNIMLKTPTGGKLALLANGGLKLFNKDNYGIEVKADGDIIIRAKVHVDTTTTPGTFP